MRRRDFVRGLLALGVTAAVADKLAFVEGLGRVFPSAQPPLRVWDDFNRADSALGADWLLVDGTHVIDLIPTVTIAGDGSALYSRPRSIHRIRQHTPTLTLGPVLT